MRRQRPRSTWNVAAIETNEFRTAVGAGGTFLSDPGRRLQKDVQVGGSTDPLRRLDVTLRIDPIRDAAVQHLARGLDGVAVDGCRRDPLDGCRVRRPGTSCGIGEPNLSPRGRVGRLVARGSCGLRTRVCQRRSLARLRLALRSGRGTLEDLQACSRMGAQRARSTDVRIHYPSRHSSRLPEMQELVEPGRSITRPPLVAAVRLLRENHRSHR